MNETEYKQKMLEYGWTPEEINEFVFRYQQLKEISFRRTGNPDFPPIEKLYFGKPAQITNYPSHEKEISESINQNFWNQFDSSGGIVKYSDTVLKEDMFQEEYPEGILLDAGYYQDRFRIYVISEYDWEHPLAVYECQTSAELLNLMRKAKEKIQCIKSSS